MNKLFLSAVSALAVAGVAIAADSTQFGVLKVPSTAAKTIVAVPWLESCTTDKAVAVSNLVLTAGLTTGDELKWYDSNASDYKVWTLAESGGVKYWSSPTMVSGSGSGTTADPSTQGIARGQAIILVRKGNAPLDGFYIMGKPATSESGEIALPGGNGSPVWTLIAPAKTSAVKLSELSWQNMASFKDHIVVDINGVTTELDWAGSSAKWVNSLGVSTDVTIPAGQGFWFYSTKVKDGRKVSWQ